MRTGDIGEPEGPDRRYACLSHQWGKPDDATKATMTTTLSTVNDRIKGVDFSNLPKRYQEAMMICKFLGIRYIWIDSLCIIQVSHSQSLLCRLCDLRVKRRCRTRLKIGEPKHR